MSTTASSAPTSSNLHAAAASSSSPAVASVSGTFALHPESIAVAAAGNEEKTWPTTTITHSFLFDSSHPPPALKKNEQPTNTNASDNSSKNNNSATSAAASSAAGADGTDSSQPARPVCVSANTIAYHPSQLPRTCPTDTTLSALAEWLRCAQTESDRFLTHMIAEREAAVQGVWPRKRSEGAD